MVRTVSRAQVGQPVNARGLGRWRAYAAELAPLIAELRLSGMRDGGRCTPSEALWRTGASGPPAHGALEHAQLCHPQNWQPRSGMRPRPGQTIRDGSGLSADYGSITRLYLLAFRRSQLVAEGNFRFKWPVTGIAFTAVFKLSSTSAPYQTAIDVNQMLRSGRLDSILRAASLYRKAKIVRCSLDDKRGDSCSICPQMVFRTDSAIAIVYCPLKPVDISYFVPRTSGTNSTSPIAANWIAKT